MSHGGNLDEAAGRYRRPRAEWLDLSTGINPRCYPAAPAPADVLAALPQDEDRAALEAAARAVYGAAESLEVVAVPGTQAAIQWLPRIVPARRRVCVVATTYGEHARAWRAAGHAVRSAHPAPAASDTADVVVLVNPNNPDGRTLPPPAVLSLARSATARRGLLVVDEAFADAAPNASVLPSVADERIVVLRSFGKFFGLAGVRLGFALAPPSIAARLRAALGPWAVSGPAIAIARTALADRTWQAATTARLARDAERLDRVLVAAGLEVVGGTPLFRLVERKDAATLHHDLAREGVWVRRFEEAPDWLRFGLPGDDDGFRRLEAALGEAVHGRRKVAV